MPYTYKTYASNDTLSKRADDLTYNEILDRNRIKILERHPYFPDVVLDEPIRITTKYSADTFALLETTTEGETIQLTTSNGGERTSLVLGFGDEVYFEYQASSQSNKVSLSVPVGQSGVLATTNDISTAVAGLANAIALSYNATTGVVTATLKHGNTTVDTATLDLPLESTIVSASYDNATKDLTFTLQTGSTITVPLDDIISGLATETYVTSAISTATTGMATQTYVTSAISTALADYVTSASLSTTLASYVTSSYLTTNYYNKTTSDANYAPKSPTWSTYPTIA